MTIKTKQRQIREVIKCGKDPIYFFNKYCKIQHVTRGTISFNTYPFQDNCVNDFIKNRFNVILKARQLGLSTLTAAYSVWLALFQKDQRILVIATKLDVAKNFIRKVKTLLDNIPKWMIFVKMETNSKQEVAFSHGSSIKAIPTSEDAGRSESLSLLIIDEAAFVRNFDTIWTGIYPTLSTGGRAIVLSTPNGVGGQYYDIYTNAEEGLNEFNAIRLPWTVNPDTDQEWFDKMTANMSKRQIAQEYLCDFIASGETMIGEEDFRWLQSIVEPPKERTGPARNVWIWQYPLSQRKYIITADVARGDSKDYSTFHVFDTSNNECVCEYKGKAPPDELGQMLAEYGYRYNKATLCPENNSYGYATLMKLRDIKYPNVHVRQKRRAHIVHYGGNFAIEDAGFNTNNKTKNIILTKLEEMIRNKSILIKSSRFYEESKRFVWKGNKAQAMSGYNDDLIISAAIGSYLLDTEYSSNGIENEVDYVMLRAMGVTSSKYKSHKYSKSAAEEATGIDTTRHSKNGIDISKYRWLF